MRADLHGVCLALVLGHVGVDGAHNVRPDRGREHSGQGCLLRCLTAVHADDTVHRGRVGECTCNTVDCGCMRTVGRGDIWLSGGASEYMAGRERRESHPIKQAGT